MQYRCHMLRSPSPSDETVKKGSKQSLNFTFKCLQAQTKTSLLMANCSKFVQSESINRKVKLKKNLLSESASISTELSVIQHSGFCLMTNS